MVTIVAPAKNLLPSFLLSQTVTDVALKLAMNSHLPLRNEFTPSIAKKFALFVPPLSNGSTSDRLGTEDKMYSFTVLPIEKRNQINTKNYWKLKMRLCVRLLQVKNYTWKSADRKAQISKALVPLTGLICALWSADFLRKCFSPRETSRTISFSISNSFWYYMTTDLVWLLFSFLLKQRIAACMASCEFYTPPFIQSEELPEQ